MKYGDVVRAARTFTCARTSGLRPVRIWRGQSFVFVGETIHSRTGTPTGTVVVAMSGERGPFLELDLSDLETS